MDLNMVKIKTMLYRLFWKYIQKPNLTTMCLWNSYFWLDFVFCMLVFRLLLIIILMCSTFIPCLRSDSANHILETFK